MTLPEPHPGLVISYAYLWRRQQAEGREDAVKDRPCAIVMVAQTDPHGRRDVIVLPVTHSPPRAPNSAIAIPAPTCRRLGLDDRPQWVVLDEANRFTWPGPDLRPVPGTDSVRFAYGVLPPRFFEEIKTRLVALYRARKAHAIRRSE